MDRIECLVIGAGVVGLATARALALAGRDVIVLDPADAIGTGASSRNSEVIHAGMYYAPGSLKAALCVRGRHLLYAYCEANHVDHKRCGKLIVAASEADRRQLDQIAARGAANGVTQLHRLTRDDVRAMEPDVECVEALWSPDTGIVDSHGLMTAFLHDAESAGAVLALRTAFQTAERADGAWRVTTRTAQDVVTLDARWLINCAGLDAQAVARSMTGFPEAHIPALYVAKGHYFSLAGASPFTRLVYPTPTDGGLGIHLTLDLGGQARFGPDVEWLAEPDAPRNYAVDPGRAAAFAASIRRYWPALPDDALRPGYTGIRAKLSGPGQPAADFRIDAPAVHGVPGVIQCFGIESPGLTASLAIANEIASMVV